MSSLTYHLFTSTSLITLGLYHLISTTLVFLKCPSSFHSKPFHPLPTLRLRLRLLPLYLLITALFTTFLHSSFLSSYPDPLILGHSPVHYFTSLTSASVSSLFLIISFFLLVSESTSFFSLLPSDLFFASASSAFFLSSSSSSSRASLQTSHLQSKCDSISALISLASSFLCLSLALFPRLFVLDVALSASVILQGFWSLQTGLTLYVDAFIPQGCHRLLDVVSGVEGSTKCELDESKLRAVAILDFAFVLYVAFVVVLVFLVYAVVCKVLGVSRRLGSYEALPSTADTNHVQLKTLSGTQA